MEMGRRTSSPGSGICCCEARESPCAFSPEVSASGPKIRRTRWCTSWERRRSAACWRRKIPACRTRWLNPWWCSICGRRTTSGSTTFPGPSTSPPTRRTRPSTRWWRRSGPRPRRRGRRWSSTATVGGASAAATRRPSWRGPGLPICCGCARGWRRGGRRGWRWRVPLRGKTPHGVARGASGAVLLRRLELHRYAVHAVAQAGGLGAVGEDVAEVAAAAGAADLGAVHEEAAVGLGGDVRRVDRREEARPAGAGVELGVRGEERQAAGGADEDAFLVDLVERAGEGPLRALVP